MSDRPPIVPDYPVFMPHHRELKRRYFAGHGIDIDDTDYEGPGVFQVTEEGLEKSGLTKMEMRSLFFSMGVDNGRRHAKKSVQKLREELNYQLDKLEATLTHSDDE